MNKKIEAMKQEIRRRGASFYLSEDLPDEIAEQFLAEILDCPDCKREAALKGEKLEH
jgi:hypothetical protein